MIKITAVDPQDLPAILRIERLGFNEAEAGTVAQYQARINQLADTFLAARDADQLVGFIVGPVVDARFKYIEDWMYEANVQNRAQPGGNQRDWLQPAASHRKTVNSKPAASRRADLFAGSRAIL